MNFLAHAYLSFNDPDILVGNIIADFVKGKQIDSYPNQIKRGIIVHREIDNFTDNFPLNIETKSVFSKLVGKYNASFLDVSFDYFLANDISRQPLGGWQKFAENCYKAIEERAIVLPAKFCSMFMYMKSENWLYNYQYKWMIQRSFERLQRRAKFLSEDINVFTIFEENQIEIQNCYDIFFPKLEEVTKKLIET